MTHFVFQLQWKYNPDKLPVHDVKLDCFLSRILRDHQQKGVTFLYSCISGISNVKYNGAVLADEMGLGKTLQCISLIWFAIVIYFVTHPFSSFILSYGIIVGYY